ncbi:hypothetical protein ACFQ9V_05625 [Leifsonia sp. NPDC056665]|uniref:hypothetical protein n=1 Tax=Leifsonia sp. NPDC056665 TaxID=3345901 RepID=UPI00369198DB
MTTQTDDWPRQTRQVGEAVSETHSPVRTAREYGLYGVWSRVGWMVFISAVVADFVWVAALTVSVFPIGLGWNPNALASQTIRDLLARIEPGDAWAFLGVFAAIVVAIQVAASTNQQARNPIADAR